MLGCSIFWLKTGDKLDRLIIKFFGESLLGTKYFSKFHD